MMYIIIRRLIRAKKVADSFQVLRRYEIKRSLNGFIKDHLRAMFQRMEV